MFLMATNLSHDDELRGLLSDVVRKRFTNSRQVNPVSNLFLTAKDAVEHQYISGAVLDETFSSTLAEMNLKNAVLTERGRNKLAELLDHATKEP